MTQIKVLNAEIIPQAGQLFWNVTVEVTKPGEDPVVMGHVFPDDVFEWRVAEYGYDPERDREKLLQMILHEPYMEEDKTHPQFLYNAPDLESAREYKDQLLQDALQDGMAVGVKGRAARAFRDDPLSPVISRAAEEDDPLSFMLDQMHIDPEQVEAKKQVVGAGRVHVRQQRMAQARMMGRSDPLAQYRANRRIISPGTQAAPIVEGLE
jgi:hypothetical protein